MAKSATERKREQRVRDKLCAKEKETLLLSRKIVTVLYHNDDAALKRTMARTRIDEEQDLISRFIRGANSMTDQQLAEFIRLRDCHVYTSLTLKNHATSGHRGRRHLEVSPCLLATSSST